VRSLTQRQSVACETAATTRCTCRCGGAFHGANRQAAEQALAYVVQLPEEDPHYVANKTYQLRLPVPIGSAA
jgi:hypothetical protein